MNTDFEIAQKIATEFDLDEDAARETVEFYITRLEAVDGTSYDRDELTDEQATAVVESVRGWLGADQLPDQVLGEVVRVTEKLQAAQSDVEFLSHVRDNTVVRALLVGATVTATAEAAGLSRKGIYVIRDRVKGQM